MITTFLTIVIMSLIGFFLLIGIVALILFIIYFCVSNDTAAGLMLSQVVLVCFVIALVGAIAAKGVGL